MRGTRIGILLATVLLASATTLAAQTKHYTITVPVEVHNLMAEVTGIAVRCTAYPDATLLTGRVGQGLTRQPISTATGSFTGNVIVAFDADAGQDPARGKAYNCGLELTANVPGQPADQPPFEGSASPVYRPAPGTPFVAVVSGALQ